MGCVKLDGKSATAASTSREEGMMKKRSGCAVFPASREIIENKLLLALEDESTVAAILTHQDLNELIDVLETCRASTPRVVSMIADMKKLRDAAFPTGAAR